jgi:hypothetical protein
MSDDKYRIMLSGYIDDELTPEEKVDFEKHLKDCPECQNELKAFHKLREVTGAMKYADIPEHVWENYWTGLYRRLERGIGWVFLSIGIIILLSVGAYYIIRDLFLDPAQPFLLKIGIGSGAFGLIVLLVSVIRERIFASRRDRYDEVQR